MNKIDHNILQNIIIVGATGVGKSDLADLLALEYNAEIVNADLGQLYTPLNIGTAKPELDKVRVKHHLFNIIDEPVDFTALDYKKELLKTVFEINSRNKIAIIVGGSHFYIQSLLFSLTEFVGKTDFTGGSWPELQKIDAERASKIHQNDQYRIDRALGIYYSTGQKPSSYEPIYNPPWSYKLIVVNRKKLELEKRIIQRIDLMLAIGWYQEAQSFKNSIWESFIIKKGLIGYDKLMDTDNPEKVKQLLINETLQYAKIQKTFIKALLKKICKQEVNSKKVQISLIWLS